MVELKIIKQAIAFRAKYRKHGKKFIATWSVVPHPSNRGGEVVKSSRTKQISDIILQGGYDSAEADFNAVVIERKPELAVAGSHVQSFQALFAASVAADPDMAVSSDEPVAVYGSVSHSHANMAIRNVLTGKKGCMCTEQQLAVAGKCECDASPILDENGTRDSGGGWYEVPHRPSSSSAVVQPSRWDEDDTPRDLACHGGLVQARS